MTTITSLTLTALVILSIPTRLVSAVVAIQDLRTGSGETEFFLTNGATSDIKIDFDPDGLTVSNNPDTGDLFFSQTLYQFDCSSSLSDTPWTSGSISSFGSVSGNVWTLSLENEQVWTELSQSNTIRTADQEYKFCLHVELSLKGDSSSPVLASRDSTFDVDGLASGSFTAETTDITVEANNVVAFNEDGIFVDLADTAGIVQGDFSFTGDAISGTVDFGEKLSFTFDIAKSGYTVTNVYDVKTVYGPGDTEYVMDPSLVNVQAGANDGSKIVEMYIPEVVYDDTSASTIVIKFTIDWTYISANARRRRLGNPRHSAQRQQQEAAPNGGTSKVSIRMSLASKYSSGGVEGAFALSTGIMMAMGGGVFLAL